MGQSMQVGISVVNFHSGSSVAAYLSLKICLNSLPVLLKWRLTLTIKVKAVDLIVSEYDCLCRGAVN